MLSSSFQVMPSCLHKVTMWPWDVLSECLYSSLAAVVRMPLYKLFVIEDQCDLKSSVAGSVIGQYDR